MNDCDAPSLTSDTVPNNTTMTISVGNVRTPSTQANGMAANNTARVRSVTIMTGRRRTRSTIAPTTSPSTR